jgi:hypothetical protein
LDVFWLCSNLFHKSRPQEIWLTFTVICPNLKTAALSCGKARLIE